MATPTPTGTIASSSAQNGRPADLPTWATGDPFFDTMAGMDPSEYDSLYKKNTTDQPSEGQREDLSIERQMSTLSTAEEEGSSSSLSASTANRPGEDPNIGLAFWNKRREEWTGGQWKAVESKNGNNPLLKVFNMSNKHVAIYESLVYDKKRLQKPIPLPLVVNVLVSGWKSEGLWQEAAASSATVSAPPVQPSAPQINSYIPGFSSTHSQPINKRE